MKRQPPNDNSALNAAAGILRFPAGEAQAQADELYAALMRHPSFITVHLALALVTCWINGAAVTKKEQLYDLPGIDLEPEIIGRHFDDALNAAKFTAFMTHLKIPKPITEKEAP